ncbi:hypothetical protein AGABI1DRAFT_131421 [Agaricus bisporus var. burnettii JB137-S8]|uniref:Uncharacterized protein n=1 Tax=Agaricus bisporus var. burnettii (strain JB137-S8 / ATCC MYA-4627 / FGSC 10392) TaxID=597362 RepID=K5WLZ0_AGABU|nr:uncharacterized protein AGABI1DRAFT_131421 [Agaricus bisporus var. burnettii JB137-S8]EKM76331.1 hypothetical protein AGABI1DRAFT_131421 [Agaricus bisporus var. burnettii JB137-S8]
MRYALRLRRILSSHLEYLNALCTGYLQAKNARSTPVLCNVLRTPTSERPLTDTVGLSHVYQPSTTCARTCQNLTNRRTPASTERILVGNSTPYYHRFRSSYKEYHNSTPRYSMTYTSPIDSTHPWIRHPGQRAIRQKHRVNRNQSLTNKFVSHGQCQWSPDSFSQP